MAQHSHPPPHAPALPMTHRPAHLAAIVACCAAQPFQQPTRARATRAAKLRLEDVPKQIGALSPFVVADRWALPIIPHLTLLYFYLKTEHRCQGIPAWFPSYPTIHALTIVEQRSNQRYPSTQPSTRVTLPWPAPLPCTVVLPLTVGNYQIGGRQCTRPLLTSMVVHMPCHRSLTSDGYVTTFLPLGCMACAHALDH